MAQNSRPLSEVYSGSLSRNWPKLLEALESGETRILAYKEYKKIFRMERYLAETSEVVNAVQVNWENPTFKYSICGGWTTNPHEAFARLQKFGIGFFPTNDSEK